MTRLSLIMKRAMDVAVAIVALVLLSPLILIINVAIKLTLGSPVVFRQPRIGQHGEEFTIIKFRTMTDERDEHGELLSDEKRLTALGRFLRSTSLDELLEILNVLKGNMSLVGPRPLLVIYKDRYSPEHWKRHDVKPGMAGLAMCKGRNGLSWDEKMALDVWYVQHWSLWLDIKILFLSVLKLVTRQGVSAKGHATMPYFEGTRARGDASERD